MTFLASNNISIHSSYNDILCSGLRLEGDLEETVSYNKGSLASLLAVTETSLNAKDKIFVYMSLYHAYK